MKGTSTWGLITLQLGESKLKVGKSPDLWRVAPEVASAISALSHVSTSVFPRGSVTTVWPRLRERGARGDRSRDSRPRQMNTSPHKAGVLGRQSRKNEEIDQERTQGRTQRSHLSSSGITGPEKNGVPDVQCRLLYPTCSGFAVTHPHAPRLFQWLPANHLPHSQHVVSR